MNFNPLIRMDAYYMLMDWTGIPNLQKKAFDFIRMQMTGWIKKRPDTDEPPPTAREKRIFIIYGVLSAAMSFLFIVFPFWRLAHVLTAHRQFTIWGVFALLTVTFLVGNMLGMYQERANYVKTKINFLVQIENCTCNPHLFWVMIFLCHS